VGCSGEEAGGPPGWKGEKGKFLFFLFFFKLFSKQLLNSNSNQISFKSFTKFYNLFKSHTSNQNHAKPNNDAQPLVVSILIKLSLIL
jgi:hypothetical protein